MTTTNELTVDLSIDQMLHIPVQLDAAAFQRLPEGWPSKQMPSPVDTPDHN